MTRRWERFIKLLVSNPCCMNPLDLDEWHFAEYFDKVKLDLKTLINERRSAPDKKERLIQSFFEQNPSSCLSCLAGVESQYRVFGQLIIAQPSIKSLDGDRRPDFLIVTWDSLNLYFNFIEIEDPSKLIFAQSGLNLSNDFNQAFGQLKQWKSFQNDEVKEYCARLLTSLFYENFNNTRDKYLNYNYILVYGFSDEVSAKGPRFNALLQDYFKEANVHHCTYSRLLANIRDEAGMFTVKKDSGENNFYAVSMSPFRKYGPDEWSDFHNIVGKQIVVEHADYLTKEEKGKLISEINDLDGKTVKEIHRLMDDDMGVSI